MKRRLLDHLRCLECGSPLRVENPVFHPVREEEIMGGALACARCGRFYPVRAGIPSFLEGLRPHARTRSSFGYLWSRSAERPEMPARYHLDRMRESLRLPPPQGLVLDAGCGEGIDLINAARDSLRDTQWPIPAEGADTALESSRTSYSAELIGVELSDGGSRVSFQRAFWHPSVHVIQADLARLPFAPETFDFIYSYGVLHHLPDPAAGMRELARLLKPGASAAVYLYEDFSDRRGLWRWMLAWTNRVRRLTPLLPHPLLYTLCMTGSPVVFSLFTVPHRILRLLPAARGLAEGFPFRQGTGPFSLVGDLYDRFSTPIERRYSREAALALLREAGLKGLHAERNRGWMVLGSKPAHAVSVPGTVTAWYQIPS